MFEIYKKLSVFDKVKYYDEPHVYFIGEKQVISCTTLIHKFQNEFEPISNLAGWAAYITKDITSTSTDVLHVQLTHTFAERPKAKSLSRA